MNSIRRGTTPMQAIGVKADLTDATVYVTYSQDGKTVVEKTNNEIVVDDGKVLVPLSQADTLAFAPGLANVQIRYKTNDGKADASNILSMTVKDVLKDGEI